MKTETLDEILSVFLIIILILLTAYIETIDIYNFICLCKQYESQNFRGNFERAINLNFNIINCLYRNN